MELKIEDVQRLVCPHLSIEEMHREMAEKDIDAIAKDIWQKHRLSVHDQVLKSLQMGNLTCHVIFKDWINEEDFDEYAELINKIFKMLKQEFKPLASEITAVYAYDYGCFEISFSKLNPEKDMERAKFSVNQALLFIFVQFVILILFIMCIVNL